IVYIVPGFGGTYYCQNCIRNLDLANELRKRGHSVIITSMYIPLKVDAAFKMETPMFYGAINVYLRQKFSIFRKIPLWVEKLLDAKFLLKWISRKSSSTDPKGLEEMTISVMKGDKGKHAKELQRLITWLKEEAKPDVVHLSNSLLVGIGVKIKKKLNIPVFSTLQDEDTWLDKMEEPYLSQAWKIIKESEQYIDKFISVSKSYAELIMKRTNINKEKITVLPIGIPLQKYMKKEPNTEIPTIGFLSRMSDSLGLDILIDAFILLKKNKIFTDLKLKISGGMAPGDEKFVNKLKDKLIKNDFHRDVIFVPGLYMEDINNFFDSLTVLCVPALHGEAFGIFLIEAMACGIPVVEPELGGYPEIINETGGGVLYKPNNALTLAESLKNILNNPKNIKQMSINGINAVHDKYSIEKMADKLLNFYEHKGGF
ncbi:MAG: putative hexosyltransferase, partial [uncultured bacterium]